MSAAAVTFRSARPQNYRRRRLLTRAASAVFGLALVAWALLPVYNILLIALDPDEGETEFAGFLFPPEPSLKSFNAVFTQDYWYLEHFWQQFATAFTSVWGLCS